jgi:hypothetical protein
MRGFATATGRRLACFVRPHFMRTVGAIYVISAIAALGVGVYLLLTVGAGMELLVLVLLSGAFLVLARGLVSGKSGAAGCAIGVSSLVALGLFLLPLYCYVQRGWAGVAAMWPLLAAFVVFAIAHSIALAFLFGAKSSAA